MKKIFPLLLATTFAAFAAFAAPQSGRKGVRPPTQPAPPVQELVWSQPDPEFVPEPIAPAELHALPESLSQRQLKSLDNSSFRLADFGGKVVVVNLWASWCPPCRAEVPEYEKVRKEYAGRNVEFIGLTTEDPRTSSDRVREFVRKLNFGFRVGWADRETARTLMNGRASVPQTLVIAPDGRIGSHWVGYSRGAGGDHLRAAIERVLSEASNTRGEVGNGESDH